MKNKFLIKTTIALASIWAFGAVSCTKLTPKLKAPTSAGEVQAGTAPTPPSLSKVYEQLNQLITQGNWYAMEEHTTDELMGPTRGTDWDDFGTWRKLHLHAWDASHNQINDTWNGLNGALFQTTLVAETASGQAQAEAKFLRAYFSYLVCDLWGQVQHRPATAAPDVIPDVYTRSEAIDFIISELEAALPNLPTYTHANRNMANKEAAEFLLAKCYLNKAVYKQDPTHPEGPYTFAAADMNKVISYCDAIAANPALSIATNYWDNFKWDNGTTSTENIFVRQNSQGINVQWLTCMGFHYNQAPSGWNGFTTLADFYNSFDAADIRRGTTLAGYNSQMGSGPGFLVGQIQGPQGGHVGNPIVNLKDRSGNPLVFTPDVSLFFSTETRGIRTVKYPLDPSTINSSGGGASTNEFAFFRLADARLMKAEAILRGGTATGGETPVSIVNSIRANRGVTTLASIDLTGLLAERGRELYLEGWRRNDMIRYGVFNNPVGERPQASAGYKVVFPIPNISLTSNPNLHQNYGY
jgi:starch-binding outer membrane protein, SusD/RagB family